MSSLPPNATISAKPYSIDVPQAKLDELQQLLKLSKLPPPTYEGRHRRFGVTSAWMKEAKERWEGGGFDWRASEAKLNKFPQYLTTLKTEDGLEQEVHFVGIFSKEPNAVPLLLLHGWPGSWIEFQHLIPLLQQSTSPSFHIIVPSLPGYGASQTPTLERDFSVFDIAYLVDQLMTGLGFGSQNGGYFSQGGDLGAFISRILGTHYPESCKATHLNLVVLRAPPEDAELEKLDAGEKAGVEKMNKFRESGTAYAMEHATRPSTIGHVLASSPLALLAWVGEKWLDWSDKDPTIDQILESVAFWWLTETFPRSIYPYRDLGWFVSSDASRPPPKIELVEVKTGYSYFPQEIAPVPELWARKMCKLVYFARHERGGHFAAFEEPQALADDIVGFVKCDALKEIVQKFGKAQ